jgi:hypothetical protein
MPLTSPFPYVVCYDMKQMPEHYQKFYEELKRSYRWWHYLDSTWIVLRYDTLVEFSSKIRPLIYQTDRLLIMPAKGPADGWLPEDAWKWINAHVPTLW